MPFRRTVCSCPVVVAKAERPDWAPDGPVSGTLRDAYRIAADNQDKFRRRVAAAFKTMGKDLDKAQIEKIIRDSISSSAASSKVMEEVLSPLIDEFADKMATAYESVIVAAATDEYAEQAWESQIFTRPNGAYIVNNFTEEFLNKEKSRWFETLHSEKSDQLLDVIQDGVKNNQNSRAIAKRLKDLDLQMLPSHERAMQKRLSELRTSLAEEGASQSVISRRVGSLEKRLTRKYRNYRADMISRTEVIRAEARGRQEAWLTARQEGNLPPTAQRVWDAAINGNRTCPICISLHGTVVGLEEPFRSGYPQIYSDGESRWIETGADIPPAHPMCRCSITLRIP